MTGVPGGCTTAAKWCGFEIVDLPSPHGDPERSATRDRNYERHIEAAFPAKYSSRCDHFHCGLWTPWSGRRRQNGRHCRADGRHDRGICGRLFDGTRGLHGNRYSVLPVVDPLIPERSADQTDEPRRHTMCFPRVSRFLYHWVIGSVRRRSKLVTPGDQITTNE